jgi:hypothetical protein
MVNLEYGDSAEWNYELELVSEEDDATVEIYLIDYNNNKHLINTLNPTPGKGDIVSGSQVVTFDESFVDEVDYVTDDENLDVGVEIDSGYDKDSESVTVFSGVKFNGITAAPDTSVGQDLVVDIEYQSLQPNDEVVEGVLVVGGENKDTKQFTVTGEATENKTLSWTTSSGDDGDYTVTVNTLNDSQSTDVSVISPIGQLAYSDRNNIYILELQSNGNWTEESVFALDNADRNAAYHPDKKEVAYMDSNQGVHILDATNNVLTEVANFGVVSSADQYTDFRSANYSPDASLLTFAANSIGVFVYDISSETQVYSNTNIEAWHSEFSPDGSYLGVSTKTDFRVLDTSDWSSLLNSSVTYRSRRCTFVEDSNKIAVADDASNGRVRVFDVVSRSQDETLSAWSDPVYTVTSANTKDRLLGIDSSGNAYIYDTTDYSQIDSFTTSGTRWAQYNWDDTYIATGGYSGGGIFETSNLGTSVYSIRGEGMEFSGK